MTHKMSPFVFLFLLNTVLFVASEDLSNDREERLRSALIDAFQTIKKGSGKDFNDEPLNSDLIGSVSGRENLTKEKSTTEDFGLFEDDDGLTFAEAFGDNVQTEKQTATTVKSHNVQHIVKTTKPYEKSTNKPLDNIINKLSDSIRNTVNETRSNLQFLKNDNLNDNETLLGMDRMLRVFDAEILVKQWKSLQKNVAGDCRSQMNDYVEGLIEKQLWAMKMDDASGRYTTMFYWGNNYWTGSSELCNALNDQRNVHHHENKTEGSEIFTAWREDVSLADEGPPFSTAFYMLRLKVTTNIPNIIKTHRTLHLGLCLPRVCTPDEIGTLVDATKVSLLAHEVLVVRSAAHAAFRYLNDTTFLILLGVTSLVIILLITATVYDMKLARDVRKQRQRVENMRSADTNSSNTDLKLDLHGLDGKSVYNVNNNVAISKMSDEHLTAETSSTQDELKLSIWSELLLSFSMKANILQIFDQTVGSDTVPVVHGLRSLSMVWVIFGHTCIVVFKYADNTALRAMLEKSFLFQLIISAVYSVDTFFCLGGMLVSFLYFRTNAKGTLDVLTKGRRKVTSGILQFLGLIGYRFARLTAPYLFMLGVVEVTMKWFHFNSVFEPPAADHETCPQYWWRNVLYINTLFPVEQMCMLWSWYLSDDTQFYAVSAILLILATSHFKLSVSLTGLFFISSLLTTGYVSWTNEHIPNSEDPFTQFDKIYDKPWTRLGPYLVGMVVGWILFKTNLRIRMRKMWAWLGWIVCSSTLLFLIFGLYKTQLGVASAAVYSALSHSLWAACVGWIIIACSTGYGGWVRPLLSSPILYPFSRVTYCAYLVHPVVLRYVAMHLTHPIHLGEMLVFVLFLGLTVISYVLAFMISVAFEAPMVTMLKILSPQRKPHRV